MCLFLTNFLKICWEQRHNTWKHTEPSCMIDVTECEICEPQHYEWEYFSVKHQQHSLKYEIALSMDERIIWVNGPFKGSANDLTIARSEFVRQLPDNERALADLGYLGDWHFIVPYKPARDHEQRIFNLHHYTLRQSIERVNKRVKQFNCLKNLWRLRGEEGFFLHKCAFHTICYLTQLSFEEQPLSQ